MSPSAIPLPPFTEVEAALRKTTEFLALELSCPSTQPPLWSEFEWRVAQAVAAMQGISALLSATLQWTGPEHWQVFLAAQKRQTLLRQARIEELLSRTDALARDAGLGFIALKGAALLQLGIYPPGQRPMGDVDLLVRSDDLDVSTRLLSAIGYIESFESWRHKVFAPCAAGHPVLFGEHVDNPINIELHTRIASRLPLFETDITPFALRRRLSAGLNPYPSTAVLMRHLLLNAAGDMPFCGSRLIQLHDIALLAGRMRGADWNELFESHRKGELWWAFPPMMLTARYYPAAIPASVIETLESDSAWLLRRAARRYRLADVSWSQIRIQAFPGIEWSRSLREALLFALSRIRPGAEVRAEMNRALAAESQLTRVSWYELSRPRRMLRWIVSRPPRVQTMLSVRSALGLERT